MESQKASEVPERTRPRPRLVAVGLAARRFNRSVNRSLAKNRSASNYGSGLRTLQLWGRPQETRFKFEFCAVDAMHAAWTWARSKMPLARSSGWRSQTRRHKPRRRLLRPASRRRNRAAA